MSDLVKLEEQVRDVAGSLEAQDLGTLARYEQACDLAIVQAKTAPEIKGLMDKFEAMRQLAKRMRIDEQTQNVFAESKLKTMRKLGQELARMEKNRGGRPEKTGSESEPVSKIPTLEEVGIAKATSSRAQVIGRMPEERFEEYIEEKKSKGAEITASELEQMAKKLETAAKKAADRARAAENAQGIEIPDRLQLVHGDFRDILGEQPEESVDLVFTDPPYHESALVLWSDLASWSASALKPGGFLLAYSGQRFLDRVFARVGDHLEYYWTLAVDHTHGQLRFWDYRCWNSWKPVLVWRKPGGEPHNEWFRDRLTMGDAKAKDYHEWAQPLAHAEKLLEKFSAPGELVVDPMCGAATIPLACILNGRLAVGVEEDAGRYENAKERIKVALNEGVGK